MNVNKKFDRFKQWAGEKMGGEAKTTTSDDFRALEQEMNLRHDGLERLHRSMSQYVKVVGKKSEGDEREKHLPVGYLGTTMVGHGHDFAPESEFGSCLTSLGRANETIARRTEGYILNATNVWLESLERSLAQMKEYQAARKKLEARRLAYDASLAKMQKAKKEDFRVEEELRSQKAKYEESSEDVYRRMEEIKEAEVESIADLTKFLDEEMAYHKSCLDVLSDLRRNWPGVSATAANGDVKKPTSRGRSNTAHSFQDRFNSVEEEPELPPRIAIPKTTRTDSVRNDSPIISRTNSRRESPPSYSRFAESESRSTYSPISAVSVDTNSDAASPGTFNRPALRPVGHSDSIHSDYSIARNNPPSPPGSVSGFTNGVKKAPPPPPLRAKKPAPPPPMKRALSIPAGTQ